MDYVRTFIIFVDNIKPKWFFESCNPFKGSQYCVNTDGSVEYYILSYCLYRNRYTYYILVQRIHCTFRLNCEYHTKIAIETPITITPFFPRLQTLDNGYELEIEKNHVVWTMNNVNSVYSVHRTVYSLHCVHTIYQWNGKRTQHL